MPRFLGLLLVDVKMPPSQHGETMNSNSDQVPDRIRRKMIGIGLAAPISAPLLGRPASGLTRNTDDGQSNGASRAEGDDYSHVVAAAQGKDRIFVAVYDRSRHVATISAHEMGGPDGRRLDDGLEIGHIPSSSKHVVLRAIDEHHLIAASTASDVFMVQDIDETEPPSKLDWELEFERAHPRAKVEPERVEFARERLVLNRIDTRDLATLQSFVGRASPGVGNRTPLLVLTSDAQESIEVVFGETTSEESVDIVEIASIQYDLSRQEWEDRRTVAENVGDHARPGEFAIETADGVPVVILPEGNSAASVVDVRGRTSRAPAKREAKLVAASRRHDQAALSGSPATVLTDVGGVLILEDLT